MRPRPALRADMSLRLLAFASPSSSSAKTQHTMETFAELWRAAVWLSQHRRFCSVGCVLLEYATKIVLTQLPPEQQATCFRALTQTTGVDVRGVDATTLLTTALTGSTATTTADWLTALFPSLRPPPPSPASLLRDVVQDVHALASEHPKTFGDASRVLQRLGEAAVHAYLSHAAAPRPHNDGGGEASSSSSALFGRRAGAS